MFYLSLHRTIIVYEVHLDNRLTVVKFQSDFF
nr:MAG TPA: hypothetical protein [Caudoviricetes sp.]